MKKSILSTTVVALLGLTASNSAYANSCDYMPSQLYAADLECEYLVSSGNATYCSAYLDVEDRRFQDYIDYFIYMNITYSNGQSDRTIYESCTTWKQL